MTGVGYSEAARWPLPWLKGLTEPVLSYEDGNLFGRITLTAGTFRLLYTKDRLASGGMSEDVLLERLTNQDPTAWSMFVSERTYGLTDFFDQARTLSGFLAANPELFPYPMKPFLGPMVLPTVQYKNLMEKAFGVNVEIFPFKVPVEMTSDHVDHLFVVAVNDGEVRCAVCPCLADEDKGMSVPSLFGARWVGHEWGEGLDDLFPMIVWDTEHDLLWEHVPAAGLNYLRQLDEESYGKLMLKRKMVM